MTDTHKSIATAAVALLLATTPLHADDRAIFGLKGDVASVTTENSDDDGIVWSGTVSFDTDGLISSIDGAAPSIGRDEMGRPVRIVIPEEDEDGQPVDVVTVLTYSDNDTWRVATATTTTDEESWSYTYSYSTDGLTTERIYRSNGDTERFVYTYTPDRDRLGNWTGRTEIADGAEFPLTQNRTIKMR